MESTHINELLRKYWDAETSLEEERELRAYFQQTDPIPAELESFRPLFAWAGEVQEEATAPDFVHPAQEAKPAGKLRTMASFYLRAAAVVIPLALGTYLWVSNNPGAQKNQHMIVIDDDPQKALEETRRVFAMLAANMNEAKGEVKELDELNRANDILKEL